MLLDALVEHALTGKEDGAVSAPAADLLQKIDQVVSTKVAPLAPGSEAKKGRGRPRKQAQPKVSPGHSGEALHVLPQTNTEKGEEADGPMNAEAKGSAEDGDEATRRSSRRDKATVFKVSELLKPRYRAPNKTHQQPQPQQQQGGPSDPTKLPPAFPKKRGRPFKNAATAAAAAAKKAAKAAASSAAINGRDPSQALDQQSEQSLSAKKRGRPQKSHPEASAEHFPHDDRIKRTKQLPPQQHLGPEEAEEFEEEYEEDAGDGYYKEDDGPLRGTEGLQVPGDESFEGRRMELLRWRMSLMAMMKSLEVAEANLARDMAAAAEEGDPDA